MDTRLVTPADDADATDVHHERGKRRASAIYGTVITAAVIAAGGNTLSSAALEATVLVTLLVYWVAEQYATLLGEHTHAGRLPSRTDVRGSLATTWPMVTSSFFPLISLIVARLCGASALAAAEVALVVAVALLAYHAYDAGKAAGLGGRRLAAVTAVAALLGVAMIVLKALLQHQHHLY
jgi:hypothetical protein